MNKNPILFFKTLVVGIILLLIGMSVISSTGNIVDNNPSYSQNLDVVDNSEGLLLGGKITYAFIAHSGGSGLPEGSCYFRLNNPGDLNHLFTFTGDNFLSGGTWTTDGRWLCCEFKTGVLWEVDLETGESMAIGSGGTSLNGLAWDPIHDRLYGCSSTHLYEINPEDGNQTEIGEFGGFGSSKAMLALAISLDGVCYGWDVYFYGNSTLYKVDLETGEATEIGDMGISLCYAQDGAFDWETDILYLSAYSERGFLAICNVETAKLTPIGNFQGGAELTALAIPYNWSFVPYTDFTWTPTLPNPGEMVLFNASKSIDPDGYITLNEWDWDNDGVFDENHTNPIATNSWPDYGFFPVTLKVTDNSSLTGMKTKTVRVGNRPPDTPEIEGKRRFKVGEGGVYPYTIYSIDPDGDDICYVINFSEGEFETDYYSSSEEMTIKVPIPLEKGTYVLFKIKAKDIFGEESNWAILEIIVPRNRIMSNLWYQWLLERFPILEVFLRIINL